MTHLVSYYCKLISADWKSFSETEKNSFSFCLRVTLLMQSLGLFLALQQADMPLRICIDQYLNNPKLVPLLVILTAFSTINLLYRPMRATVIVLITLVLLNFFSELSINSNQQFLLKSLSQSARYLIPFAFLLLPRKMSTAVLLVRIAAAATFFGHGVQALFRSPHFIELIQSAGEYLLGLNIPPTVASKILPPIGIVDLVLAITIVLKKWSFVAGYMSAWGILTSASRTVHFGLTGVHETLMRFPNAGAPLALFLFWSLRYKTQGESKHQNSQ